MSDVEFSDHRNDEMESDDGLEDDSLHPHSLGWRRRSLDSLTGLGIGTLKFTPFGKKNNNDHADHGKVSKPSQPPRSRNRSCSLAVLDEKGFLSQIQGAQSRKKHKGWPRGWGFGRHRRGSHSSAIAIIETEDGNIEMISGDGSHIKELLAQATMEYKISSYRLIMASTRAILNSDGSGGGLIHLDPLEDVFEEMDIPEDLPVPTVPDSRYDIVIGLLRSERIYCRYLRSVLDTYAEPLRKFSSLNKDEHRILFVGLEPIISLSAMLTSKVEDALKSWDASSSKIGNLFSNKFWNHYEEYCNNYSETKEFLDEKYKTDETFVDFCKLRKGRSRYSLDCLLSFPVQRIPEYDKYLNDLLDDTAHNHPDYDDLTKAASKVRNMVKERENELAAVENHQRMENIQERFPHDDLRLREKETKEKIRHGLSSRRKSAPGAVLFKTLSTKSKSATSLLSPSTMGKREDIVNNQVKHHSNVDRHYLKEGPVEFASGMQTQDRYLFLFNNLLLVAKPKSSTHFKLKHKIRVSELWLSSCIEDVAETTRQVEKSFVLGWPTTNVVATFKTVEDKEAWLSKLKETIHEEKMKEEPKAVSLKVLNKETDQPCIFSVENSTEAREIVQMCAEQFQILESEAKDYQLWVVSGKEESPYPLIGHELPYSIKLSHIRDIVAKKSEERIIPVDYDRIMEEASTDMKCEFVLKHSKKSPKKQSLEDHQKTLKKSKKSPLMNFFQKKVKRPQGKLYGHPLEEISREEGLPKPVLELLTILFRDGPYTVGILRKSPNAKMVKELRQKLDEEEEWQCENYPALVIGAVVKEYFRSLPVSLLLDDLYDDWLKVATDFENSPEKLEKYKQLLQQLPQCSFHLLRHLVCVLYHIDRKSDENMMTAYNLSVCIVPSLLWSPKANHEAVVPANIMQFMIENCVEIFGEQTIHLFGEPVDHKVRQDSSTDSDSMHSVLSMPESNSGALRRDDSSIDSLERELYVNEIDSSPKLAKSHLSPSNLSRDSGLTLSDTQLYEDDGSGNDRDRYLRSLSYMDRDGDKADFDNVCHSLDSHFYSYDPQNPIPPPRKSRKKGAELLSASQDFDGQRNQQRYSGQTSFGSSSKYGKPKGHIAQSLQAEAFRQYKRMSTESLQSVDEESGNVDSPFGDWRRQHDMGTLIKSASGAHLYLDEEYCPPRKYVEFDADKGYSARERLVRQSSVTDSTPPMSPQSKYSYSSSQDSILSDSSSSYLSKQFSRDAGLQTPPHSPDLPAWITGSHRQSQTYRPDETHDDSSVALLKSQTDDHRYTENTSQNSHYQQHTDDCQSHMGLAARRSFPLDVETSPVGSGSTTSKEAEDIIGSPRISVTYYSDEETTSPPVRPRNVINSPHLHVHTGSQLPMKKLSMYTSGLGTSPPPRVVLQNMHQKSHKPRENTPMKASYDSAIMSQVRRNSTGNLDQDNETGGSDNTVTEHYRTEMNIGPLKLESPVKTLITLSGDDGNNGSPRRPSKPPSYDEAIQRKYLMKHGIPLEISEQDGQKQKEVSARAKKLYEQSLQKYMQEQPSKPNTVSKSVTSNTVPKSDRHLTQQGVNTHQSLLSGNTPKKLTKEETVNKQERSVDVNDVYVFIERPEKNPKKVYEESIKRYMQESTSSSSSTQNEQGQISPSKMSGNERETLAVPVCNLHRSSSDATDSRNKLDAWRNRRSPQRGTSPRKTSPQTSPQRGSSPETHGQISPVHHSRLDANSSANELNPASNQRDRSESSPASDRHYFPISGQIFYQPDKDDQREPARSRDSSMDSHTSHTSLTRELHNKDSGFNKVFTSGGNSSYNREQTYSRDLSHGRDSSQDKSPSVPVSRDSSRSSSESRTSNSKLPTKASGKDLPWSVKRLSAMWDPSKQGHTDNIGSSVSEQVHSNTSSSSSRPPPPPYQPPPPFKRLTDNTRASTSSNSSIGSTSTGRSTPPGKHFFSLQRQGPQAWEGFSSADDSDCSNRYFCHHFRDASSSSDDLDSWSYTDVTYV